MRKFHSATWALCFFVGSFLSNCDQDANCHLPQGRWSNQEGQIFEIQPDGRALWLTRFGSAYDTVQLKMAIDCREQPMAINFTDIQSGPYQGSKIYGILEWSSNTSFRIYYEADKRPQAFSSTLTQKFIKE